MRGGGGGRLRGLGRLYRDGEEDDGGKAMGERRTREVGGREESLLRRRGRRRCHGLRLPSRGGMRRVWVNALRDAAAATRRSASPPLTFKFIEFFPGNSKKLKLKNRSQCHTTPSPPRYCTNSPNSTSTSSCNVHPELGA